MRKNYEEKPAFSLLALMEGAAPKLMVYRRVKGIPIYYDRCKDDPELLILNEKVAECIRRAINYMEKGASYGDTQKWFIAASGKKISRVAVFYLHKNYLGEKKALKEARRDITRKSKTVAKLINDAKRLSAAAAKVKDQKENSKVKGRAKGAERSQQAA